MDMTRKEISRYMGKLIVAEINFHRALPSIITLYHINNDGRVSFYWEDGPSRAAAKFVNKDTVDNGEARILHVYGKSEDVDWDEIDLHFMKKYYPLNPINVHEVDAVETNEGWIAPDGLYYNAHYRHHDATARSIVIQLEERVLNDFSARKHLEKTWVHTRVGTVDAYMLQSKQGDIIQWLLLRRPIGKLE